MTQRNIEMEQLSAQYIEDEPVELVERKGIGHPDSICDAISEKVSCSLSRLYLDRFGRILHHNTDETHVIGGQAKPAFGGGEILRPATLCLVGRATTRVDAETLPYREKVTEAALKYLRSVISDNVDVDEAVKVECRLGEGSVDLRGVFEKGKGILANDTSFGCGFAPFSETENMVLQTEKFLTLSLPKKLKGLGKDVKVMGCRRNNEITLTLAVAMVGAELPDKDAYVSTIEQIREMAADNAAKLSDRKINIHVNTADNYAKDVYYLTVTGLSMENGDDGSTGRGNRANGLITPYRPMSLEAASGKNPVTHVGKIYNVLATQIASDIVKDAKGDIRTAHVAILSQIGKPVDQPQVAQVSLLTADGVSFSKVQKNARAIADDWLGKANTIPGLLMKEKLGTF
jgi:S-adenosylmethionine synthetase